MRYTDADKMLEDFKELHGEEYDLLNCYNADWIESFIEGRPTADVQEVRHGRWIETSPGYCKCSQCKKGHCCAWLKPEYCERCGAKMDGAT